MKKAFIALLAATAAAGIRAECECGYSTVVSNSKRQVTFTDLLETDFTRPERGPADANWKLPDFSITKDQTRGGKFGLNFRPANTLSTKNTVNKDKAPRSNEEMLPIIPNVGADLFVSSKLEKDMLTGAEMDSRRTDLTYGSYRASMKLTSEPGTCAAFFWYFNNTQEIDMEFISKDFDPKKNSFPVNLIVQSPQSAVDGYDPLKAGNYIRAELPFDPTKGFHEYRFDFVPGEVFFYADGRMIGQIRSNAVPTTSGSLILQHWSNGDGGWSGGPPKKDTSITVRYVKAYFNSSDTSRQRDWECASVPGKIKEKAVCEIPDIAANKSVENFFFTTPKRNKTLLATSKNGTGKGNETDKSKSTKEGAGKEKSASSAWNVQAGVVVAWAMLVGAAVFVL